MKVSPIHTRIFGEREDLFLFITKNIPNLGEGSLLVVTSKIVALAEGRVVTIKNQREKETLIKRESSWQSRVLPKWWLTVRDGTVGVNAGIDDSNGDGKTILLPRDSFATAAALRKKLTAHYKVKALGVMITDSRVAPLRAGTTGVALGYAGFKGIRDYRGTADIFGRKLEVTQTNIADGLAASAVLLMGEGSEQCPLAIIEGAPVAYQERVNRRELSIAMKDDLFRRLFKRS